VITVHGLLGTPSSALRDAAATADWVVGGRRHLDALAVPDERRIVLGTLRVAVEKIAALPESSRIVVVASGDPLYFGVVRSLRRLGLRPEVVTAPSSIASAFAAVGLPWDDAVVVSVHGRPLATAVNLARAHGKVAVFTSGEHGVRELAAGLADLDRTYMLAERLGEADERVRVLDTAEALAVEPVEPNVVLILDHSPDRPDADWPGDVAGPTRVPRSQVSAAAAVAFARLLPEPGELLWASGPLAEEVAGLARWSGAAVITPPVPEEQPKNTHTPVPEEQPRNEAASRRAIHAVTDALRDAGGSFLTAGSSGAVRVPPPDVLLTDTLTTLDGLVPRALVLTGPAPADLPTGYRWTTEQVGDHQLTTGVRE
jgi:precorrin-6y C5,15-methyltransferase (decarboxylating) CbiE subunit